MADAYRNLLQITLPSVAASLAAGSPSGGTPSATSWVMKGGAGMCVTNIDTVARTFQLWVNGSADTNVIGWGTSAKPITLQQGECRQLDAGEVLTLGPSDALYGVASVSGKLVLNCNGDAVS